MRELAIWPETKKEPLHGRFPFITTSNRWPSCEGGAINLGRRCSRIFREFAQVV